MSKINELEDLVEQVDKKINQDSRSNSDEEKIKPGILISSIIVIILVAGIFLLIKFRNNDDKYAQITEQSETKFNEGDVSGSIADLEEFLKTNLSDEVRFGTLLSLASAYAQKGSLNFQEVEYAEKSIRAVNEALEIGSNNVIANSEAYRILGYSYEIMEDYDNAILNYKKAFEINSENAGALAGLGHTYNLLGNYDLAKVNYEKAVEMDSTLDYALYNLAKILFINGEKELAEKNANLVVETSSNKRFVAESFLLLGLIKSADNNFEEAINLIEKSIETDPNLANAYVSLVEKKLLAVSPNNAGLDVFLRDKDKILSETKDLIEKAIEINPNLSYAYLIKARVLSLSKQYEEAFESLQKGLAVLPNDITLGVTEKENMEKKIRMQTNSIYFEDLK